jgi:hypothetical protein
MCTLNVCVCVCVWVGGCVWVCVRAFVCVFFSDARHIYVIRMPSSPPPPPTLLFPAVATTTVSSSSSSAAAAAVDGAVKSHGVWSQLVTAEGATYYYNSATETTQWETPEGFISDA